MLTTCFNPECHKELLYLRTGRVVRVIQTQAGRTRVEHFWLCGDCYLSHDFQLAADGTVRVVPKAAALTKIDVESVKSEEEGLVMDDTQVGITA
jgi:hypothetical protein